MQRWGAEDSCSAGLPSHLRWFPLKYKTWLHPQNAQIPSGIGSWNPTFQKTKGGPSARVQRVARFCCDLPKLLLLFRERVLFPDTG